MFWIGEVSIPALPPLFAVEMSWSMPRSRSVWTSACSLQVARSLWACSSVAPFLVQVVAWEKKEQPPRTARPAIKIPQRRLAAFAVGRRVIMEAPEPKAEFAVNLPRTGAQRNRAQREY